jgi:hypothetical protein
VVHVHRLRNALVSCSKSAVSHVSEGRHIGSLRIRELCVQLSIPNKWLSGIGRPLWPRELVDRSPRTEERHDGSEVI